MNPYSEIIDAIWAALERVNDFTALVKPANRVRGDVVRLNFAPDIVPMVAVVPTPGGSMQLFRTSDVSTIEQHFTVAITTGDKDSGANYLPLKWAVIRAAAWGQANRLGRAELILAVKVLDAAEALTESDRLAGWEGAVTFAVTFSVPNVEMVQS